MKAVKILLALVLCLCWVMQPGYKGFVFAKDIEQLKERRHENLQVYREGFRKSQNADLSQEVTEPKAVASGDLLAADEEVQDPVESKYGNNLPKGIQAKFDKNGKVPGEGLHKGWTQGNGYGRHHKEPEVADESTPGNDTIDPPGNDTIDPPGNDIIETPSAVSRWAGVIDQNGELFWGDSSRGMPESGMVYLQVLTPLSSEEKAQYSDYLAGLKNSDLAGAPAANTDVVGLPNPLAVWAEEQGWQYEIVNNPDGSQDGQIVFPTGEIISGKDAWNMYYAARNSSPTPN